MWASLIKRYWDVTLFKETPENTPYSFFLLGLFAFIYYLLVVMQWAIADIEKYFTPTTSLLAGASLILSYGLYTLILLSAFHVSNRLVQTLTCLLAGHTLVHLIAFPMLLVAPWLAEAKLPQSLAVLVGVVYLVLTLMLTIWQFMVSVHIYKHALAINYLPAVLASFGLLASNILVVSFW